MLALRSCTPIFCALGTVEGVMNEYAVAVLQAAPAGAALTGHGPFIPSAGVAIGLPCWGRLSPTQLV